MAFTKKGLILALFSLFVRSAFGQGSYEVNEDIREDLRAKGQNIAHVWQTNDPLDLTLQLTDIDYSYHNEMHYAASGNVNYILDNVKHNCPFSGANLTIPTHSYDSDKEFFSNKVPVKCDDGKYFVILQASNFDNGEYLAAHVYRNLDGLPDPKIKKLRKLLRAGGVYVLD